MAWSDSRNSLGDIYVRQSSDAGTTWSSEQVLDSPGLSPSGESYNAQVAVYGSSAGVSWEEGAHGQRDIYLSCFRAGTWMAMRVDSTGASAAVNSTGAKTLRTSIGSLVVWI